MFFNRFLFCQRGSAMKRHILMLVAATAITAAPNLAIAEFFEGNTSNDWNEPTNWDTGNVPTLLTDAAIASPFGSSTSVDIVSANADAQGLFVGLEAAGSVVNGTVNHTAFNGTFTNAIIIGRQQATGTYNQSGSTAVTTNGPILLGTNDGGLAVVDQFGGTGNYSISDTATLTGSRVIVGDTQVNAIGGVGTFTQTGGVVTGNEWVGIGNGANTVGDYNISGGTLKVDSGDSTPSGEDLNVGDAGQGTITQSGGAVSARNWVVVGKNPGSVGNYNISEGTLNAGNDLRIGQDGTGTVTQTGGTVTVAGWTVVGGNAGTGTYNLNGGALNANARLVVGETNPGSGGGTLNVNGGTLTTGDSLVVGRDTGGTLIQTAGVINTQFVDVGGDAGTAGANPGSSITMLGGTLNAANDIRVGLNANAGTPFNVGMNVFGAAVVNAAGGLEVSRDGNAHFLTNGDTATINFGGSLDANSANTAQLIWGSGANGVNDINFGVGAADPSLVNVDVTGAELLLQLVDGDPGTALVTVAQTIPSDLLLIDNQGTNPVTGLLSFNSLTALPQLLNEGDLLVDGALNLLNGLSYAITYQGGDGNDVVLQLVPEPTSIVILALGGVLLGGFRRRR